MLNSNSATQSTPDSESSPILVHRISSVCLVPRHGAFDFVRQSFIENAGVPHWCPASVLAFDVIVGAVLAVRLMGHDSPLFSSVTSLSKCEQIVEQTANRTRQSREEQHRASDT